MSHPSSGLCRELLNTSLARGITGNIEFNEEGDRIESLYEIINIQDGLSKTVGTYRTNTVRMTNIFTGLAMARVDPTSSLFRARVTPAPCVVKS